MSSGNEGQASVNEGWEHTGNSTKMVSTDGVEFKPEVPVIVHQGRYRLYEKADGGLHLVYQRDDKDEPDHMELPGALLNLAKMAGEGKMSIPEMMREVMKMRSNGGL